MNYSIERQYIFCENFRYLRENCSSHCDVTSRMDTVFTRGTLPNRGGAETGIGAVPAQLRVDVRVTKLEDCPVKTLSLIPESVDLREYNLLTKVKDQKECGSCWAHTTAAMAENLILLNAKRQIYGSAPWDKSTTSLDISELFMMGTTPSCAYCSGCDYVYAVMGIVGKKTVELESNYPYKDR